MDQERLTPGLSVAPGCLLPTGGGHSAGTPCTQKMPLVPSSTQLPLLTASRTFLRHRHMGPHCPPVTAQLLHCSRSPRPSSARPPSLHSSQVPHPPRWPCPVWPRSFRLPRRVCRSTPQIHPGSWDSASMTAAARLASCLSVLGVPGVLPGSALTSTRFTDNDIEAQSGADIRARDPVWRHRGLPLLRTASGEGWGGWERDIR